MVNTEEVNSNSVIRSIFDWSQARPLWQRDALRRIFQNISISEDDISDLYTLLFLSADELDDQAKPLLEEHLPPDQVSGNSIVLESISQVKGVNNLAEEQELGFALSGLTVVYGDNGAGKSGYTRILKSACRARHRSTVLPNVFDSNQPSGMTSLLKYSAGEESEKEYVWQNSDTPHSELSGISVFDRECASVHIQKKNEVAYRPFGLDIPDTLAEVSKALETKLKEEKQTLDRSKNAVFQNCPWSENTDVGKKLSTMNAGFDIEEIKSLSALSNDEESRLDYLTYSLAQDISKASRELDNFSANIESLLRTIENLSTKLDDDEIDNLIALNGEAKKLKSAAEVTANACFPDDVLDGVGGNVWKELWASAKKYSEEVAYPDREFPVLEIDEKCLLCQQPLDAIGSGNLTKFDAFVKNDIQDRARNAKNNFDKTFQLFPAPIKLGTSWPTIKQLVVSHPELAKQCMTFYASAKVRRNCIVNVLFHESDETIFDLKEAPIATLKATSDKCRNNAQELREALDAEKHAALISEKNELQDRKTIKSYLDVIEEEITRLKKINVINEKITETNTRSITTLGNSIADDVVTPHLRDSFLKEIIGFVGNRIRVEIKRSGGSYGSPEYKISFLSDPKRNVSTVLSEGEQTCVAIASFLAEQSTANHKSALIFDDPISSLDHKWRSIVAKRLVQGASDRQVVIFTHDLVFLNDLEDYAERLGVPFESKHLDRQPELVGFVNNSLPWDGMKIKARIDALEKEARELGRERGNLTEEKYKACARSFYSKLRTSWERALEEVALSHTVMRHRDYINPKNLKNLSALDLSDCEKWNENYGLCCDYVEAHDGSRGRNQTLPEPDGLMDDVQALADWVSHLRCKHREIT